MGACFPELPPETVRGLEAICQGRSYPRGTTLFEEGDEPRGLFILLSGSARLVMSSGKGKNFVERSVWPGETMGASEVVASIPHLAAAEVMEPSEVAFLPQAAFLRVLTTDRKVALWLAKQLSWEVNGARFRTRLLALAPNVTARFAYFLLLWAREGQRTEEGLRIPLRINQEELGEIIGATRETVNRLEARLERRGLIRVEHGSILLLRISELRRLVSA